MYLFPNPSDIFSILDFILQIIALLMLFTHTIRAYCSPATKFIFVSMNIENIKQAIGKRRRELGSSQEFMAEKLKMSLNGYRKIEVGTTSIIHPQLSEICSLLKIAPEELIYPESGWNNKEQISGLEAELVQCRSLIEELESNFNLMRGEYETLLDQNRAALESQKKLIGMLNESLARYRKDSK